MKSIADMGIAKNAINKFSQEYGETGWENKFDGKFVFHGGFHAHTFVDFELMGKRTIDAFHISNIQDATKPYE